MQIRHIDTTFFPIIINRTPNYYLSVGWDAILHIGACLACCYSAAHMPIKFLIGFVLIFNLIHSIKQKYTFPASGVALNYNLEWFLLNGDFQNGKLQLRSYCLLPGHLFLRFQTDLKKEAWYLIAAKDTDQEIHKLRVLLAKPPTPLKSKVIITSS